MFNLTKFISDSVTFRPVSMFAPDIEANKERLTEEIKGKKVCVIGGAGSIGSSFIKAALRFEPKSVVVVDLNENGLAELVRDVRSTEGLHLADRIRYAFSDPFIGIWKGHNDLRRMKARKRAAENLYIFFGILTANVVNLAGK